MGVVKGGQRGENEEMENYMELREGMNVDGGGGGVRTNRRAEGRRKRR